jgi:hypothetical protein
MYLKGRKHFSTMERWGLLVEARKILLLKYANHDFLPKSEENCDFDC